MFNFVIAPVISFQRQQDIEYKTTLITTLFGSEPAPHLAIIVASPVVGSGLSLEEVIYCVLKLNVHVSQGDIVLDNMSMNWGGGGGERDMLIIIFAALVASKSRRGRSLTAQGGTKDI